jgi:Lon-like ATP-dependent protease
LTNNRLDWQLLLPDSAPYEAIFATAAQLAPVDFAGTQPRLENGLTLFCHPRSRPRFMTLKAQENREYLSRIAQVVSDLMPETAEVTGNRYHIEGNKVTLLAAKSAEDAFAAKSTCLYREWIEPEQLFGCVRIYKDQIQLEPYPHCTTSDVVTSETDDHRRSISLGLTG